MKVLADNTYALLAAGAVQVVGGGFDLSGTLQLQVSTAPIPIVVVPGTIVDDGVLNLAVEHAHIRGPPVGVFEAELVTFSRNAAGETARIGQRHRAQLGSGDLALVVTVTSFDLLLKPDGTHALHVVGSVSVAATALLPLAISGTVAIERNTTGFDVDLGAPGDPLRAGVTRVRRQPVHHRDRLRRHVRPVHDRGEHARCRRHRRHLRRHAGDEPELLIGGAGVTVQAGSPRAATSSAYGSPTPNSSCCWPAGRTRSTCVAMSRWLGSRSRDQRTGRAQSSTFEDDVNRTVTVGDRTLVLDAPEGVTVFSGTGLLISVAEQSISGDVAVTTTPTSTHIELANVSLSIGDGNRPFVTISNGSGSIDISDAEIGDDEPPVMAVEFHGTFSGNVTLDIPGISFRGAVEVEVHQHGTEQYVRLSITAADPAGTLTPTDVTDDEVALLTVAGFTIGGNFELEQIEVGGETITRIHATDVSLEIAGIVSITDGEADLVVLPAGIAGSFGGNAHISIPGTNIDLDVDVDVRINTTPTEFDIGTAFGQATLLLPAGPFVRVELTDIDFTFEVGTLSIDASGNISIEHQTLVRRIDGHEHRLHRRQLHARCR